MDDRRTGLGRLDRRHRRSVSASAARAATAVLRAARAGHGTGDEDLAVHFERHWRPPIGCRASPSLASAMFCNLRIVQLMKSETHVDLSARRARRWRLTLLVLPGCSIMCVASAIDPLARRQPHLRAARLFDWRIVSPDGSRRRRPAGCRSPCRARSTPRVRADVLIVDRRLRHALATSPARLAGVQAGGAQRRARSAASRPAPGCSAMPGLLDGRAATTHWEDLEDFAAAFPRPTSGPTAT